jgi:prevent-host-death family protein
MEIRNITQAKTQLSRLVKIAEEGGEVVIGRGGKPVARIVKYDARQRTPKPGTLKGKIWIAPDFDDLPDDIAVAFGTGPK